VKKKSDENEKPADKKLDCPRKKYRLYLRLLDWEANPLNPKDQGESSGSRLESFILVSESSGFEPRFVNFDSKGSAWVEDVPPGPLKLKFIGSAAPLETAVSNIPYNKAERTKTPPRDADYRSGGNTAPPNSSQAEELSAQEGDWYHFHSYKDFNDGIELLVDKENQSPLFQKVYESLPGPIKALLPFYTPHVIEVKQDLTPYMEVYICDKYLKYKDATRTQIADINTYGHVALAVVVPGVTELVYDFGRYSEAPYESLYPLNDRFNYASWGILNVWNNPETYLNLERSYKRRMAGFRYYLTKLQAQDIFDFFQGKINSKICTEKTFDGFTTAYRLKDDYMALTNNCTTMTIDGMKASCIPDLIVGQYFYADEMNFVRGNQYCKFRGLYGNAKTVASALYQYVQPLDGLFMPLDLEEMLLKNDTKGYDKILLHSDESPETKAYFNSHFSYGGSK
jgi:hypothetical protein